MDPVDIMHSFNILNQACDQHSGPITKLARDHILIVQSLLQVQYGITFDDINRERW